ncbi:cytochrome c oxidase subunit II [Novosphingobium mangrovi (ex Hu et al. 2023)]|uniref:C-type cytochrome n=1 Tax=Novosphingobium mangrovi (ex Hu et al. 2023) TaxID=2930094 RepID=A0ABT0AGY7_9SPHN|nr:c-type cytochrome [Novosphingobium mangrovi (ex Hu et al. 2023)]MCJ1962463.1 c-type cytochrome [Novosphingobium mangrovi (ex Hu et al. 2023)]
MRYAILPACLLATACNTHQSALAPFGVEAGETRTLTLVMALAALGLAAITFALYFRAVRAPEGSLSHTGGMKLVLWMGAIVPTVLLAGLLLYALPAMRPMDSAPGDLEIRVEGEQFWWRVIYDPQDPQGRLVDANEIRIPTGRTVVFTLAAHDVVHSFWIPGLAGKMDMIPGRENRLVVKATKPGRYRGVCAELCGLAHALMAFEVVAVEPVAFDSWLAEHQAGIAAPPKDSRGARLFADQGCGACHAIQGTEHTGQIGPDLTRYAHRKSLGAGTQEPTLANTADFIRAPEDLKPGARMPTYTDLSREEALAIARYLKGRE